MCTCVNSIPIFVVISGTAYLLLKIFEPPTTNSLMEWLSSMAGLLHRHPAQGGKTLRQQLYERVERWDGHMSNQPSPEEVPQLMLEGIMGRLGIYCFADLNRDGAGACNLTYPGMSVAGIASWANRQQRLILRICFDRVC